ncbi:hypothetical protein [Streptomyces arenae]|uniref:hypothetical protein n=1 Tax=Streptomyces arenae TaxID=29301 RepID=UPI002659622D|nr:hypothetical protein [Streptomyces arenae]MCG7207461.1 hypothetical protein [Streptomyces arenae]
MPRRMSRTLVLSTFLAASLVLGAAPSYASMSPGSAGISDSDWAMVGEIGSYNSAYTEYVDNQGNATLVFTGGNVPSQLQYPPDFHGFSNTNLTLYGEFSQFSTNDAIDSAISDTVAQIQAAGYGASSAYNPDTDVVDVTTDAPSSVTAPLVSSYGSKISIVAGTPNISASDWALVQEISDYNGAYAAYLDAQGNPILVFTGGNVPSQLQYPSDFHGFTDRDLTLYGEFSQFSSNSAIDSTINDTATQIQAAGYDAGATYNAYTDKVDVTTNAPSTVTDPLVSTYGSKINIIAENPQSQQSGTTGTTHSSPKKRALKKHIKGKKPATKKHATKHVPTKHIEKATPAPGEVHKVVLTLPKPQ